MIPERTGFLWQRKHWWFLGDGNHMKQKFDKENLSSELNNLPSLDRTELKEKWRELYGMEAPASISQPILLRAIAYRLQENALGGLKPSIRRLLTKTAEDALAGRQIAVRTH